MADTQQLPSTEEPVRPASSPTPAPTRTGLGVAALVLGIVALAGAVVPIVNYGAAVVALVGLVLGVLAILVKNRRRGVAVAGAVVSAVALILSIALALVYSAVIATVVGDAAPASTASAPDAGTPSAEDGAVPDDRGTRGNPAPLGTIVEIDSSAGTADWAVSLGPATLDADDIIAAEKESAESAPAGLQYAMVPVTVVYRGTETGTPWAELAVDFVSAAGTTHTSSDSFASAPTPLTDLKELSPGASGTGNVVVAVPTVDVEKGAWVLSTMAGEQYFFAAE
jgi:hypothetical protein